MKSRSSVLMRFLLVTCASVILSCTTDSRRPDQLQPFALLDATRTGLHFTNTLTPTLALNVFNYMYFYNGGGVAAGDLNNDGLPDIVLTSNQGENALFLNQGDLTFKEVTSEAQFEGRPGWTTGVSLVDINHDGMLDIYVCQLGEYRSIRGKNQLFVCEDIDSRGIPKYIDRAEEYGLDLVGFSTQASFFDYDLDGDLDMYQLNHSLHENGTFGQRWTFENEPHPLAGDKLMRNDNGKFVDVTKTSGIHSSVIGYGLGLATGDINMDGWPDIYVGNDFHENDYLYINQKDGTFREMLNAQIRHTSRFSMGVDIADINNDGFQEILSLDMHPEDPFILKSALGEDDYAIFNFKIGYGYNHQYAKNNLQLNNQNHTFSEIGTFAGIYASDWSWAPLFVDFNHDGLKDIFISNGIPKRMNDIDYVNFVSEDDIQYRMKTDNMEEEDLLAENKMPEIKLLNKFYLNNGDLTFTDLSKQVLHALESYSNGAAYADFDLDGDLDIIVNNIDDNPFLYRNLTRESQDSSSFLHVKLIGSPKNRHAIGAKAIIYQHDKKIVYEHFPVKGYQSQVDFGLYIGLGTAPVDSIRLYWPDMTSQVIPPGLRDTTLEVRWQPGLQRVRLPANPRNQKLLEELTDAVKLDFRHIENPFVEFNREQLIPHMTSAEGPALATGDINADGLEDVFIGGSKRRHNGIFLQQGNGTFFEMVQPALRKDSIFEDVDAEFVDVDMDRDLDLVIASGGNEYRGTSDPMRPRIYLNDGQGLFSRSKEAFDSVYLTASCVLVTDLNGDRAPDLFFGGRAVPWNYGKTPRSYLLLNDGTGRYMDVTASEAPELADVGLVKNGAWADLDSDGDEDLVLALEWGPVTIFENRGGQLIRKTIEKTHGWWNMIIPYDFDRDGDVDFVAGNLGLNAKLRASIQEPVRLYVNDFDDNGQIEQIMTHYLHGREVVFPTYREITKQLPDLKKKFLYARDFAAADLEDLFPPSKLRSADILEAYVFENTFFENTGDLNFTRKALPDRLQFAPLRAGVVSDINLDGIPDLLLGGNYYENNIELGRYDADFGSVLISDGDGDLLNDEIVLLGITGQIRNIASVRLDGRKSFIFARNDDAALVFGVQSKPGQEEALLQ